MYTLIIIGLGISGISCATHSKLNKLNFVVLEKNNNYGGCWYNKAFDFTHLQTDSNIYRFLNFNKSMKRHPSRKEILEYIGDYINKYKLLDNVLFNSNVISVNYDKYWNVKFCHNNNIKIIQSKYLMICNGILNQPNIPKFINKDIYSKQIIHSSRLHNKISKIVNKKIVIIGNGATGLELSVYLSKKNDITLLYRKPKFILKTTVLKLPSSLLITRFSLNQIRNYSLWFFMILITTLIRLLYNNYLSLPIEKPNSKNVLSNNNIINLINSNKIDYIQDTIKQFNKNNIVLNSGREINTDLVILATGYKSHVSFMSKFKLSKYRYKYIIDPNIKNCAFIGHCASYNWLQVAELQAIWYVNVILGKIQLPNINTMKHDINIRKHKITEYNDLTYEAFDYCDELLNDIKYDNYIIKDLGYWFCKPLF